MIFRDVRRDPYLAYDGTASNIPTPAEGLFTADRARRDGWSNPFAVGWTWLYFDDDLQLGPDPGAPLLKPCFGVRIFPRNRLEVCRGERVNGVFGQGRGHRKLVISETVMAEGSRRVITDCFGLFGTSFVQMLTDWNIGRPGERRAIGAMKKRRERFELIGEREKAYNKAECALLGDGLSEVEATLARTRVPLPKSWHGPGAIASAMLEAHDAITAKRLAQKAPKAMREMAYAAFYAARFETTCAGKVRGPVYGHDLNSAFPAEMLELPCLEHGKWTRASAQELERKTWDAEALFVAPVRFNHPPSTFLCTLPVRSKEGALSWPRAGAGVYWSDEIFSARRRGAEVEIMGGWLYERRCDCRPLSWVADYYRKRLKLGSRGGPIKKALQSIYGKFLERGGDPKFANPIWAGLITARVRAKLNDLVGAAGERNVIMIAADSIFTRGARLAVPRGRGLGQWRVKRYGALFVVKPGLYWETGRSKRLEVKRKLATRGVSRAFFAPKIQRFERAWSKFARAGVATADPPLVKISLRMFVSLRLAMRAPATRGDACTWKKLGVGLAFDWRDKRQVEGFAKGKDCGALMLRPLPGSLGQWSERFDGSRRRPDFDRRWRDGDKDIRDLLEALPDPVDLRPPI